MKRLASLEYLDVAGRSGEVRISRRDVDRLPGYVVCGPHSVLGETWERIKDAGAQPAGAAVWSALRIEAGLPIWGIDLTDENLAQEAGRTASAISFTKGCYLGQEPIARLDAMGHVNRELRSLRITGEAIPSPGARVFADAASSAAVGGGQGSAGRDVLWQRWLGGVGPGSFQRVNTRAARPGTLSQAGTTPVPRDRLLGSGRRAGDTSPPTH